MRRTTIVITSLFYFFIITACNYTYSEGGKTVNTEKDGAELLLAKKSLRFIEENQNDSLKELLNGDILRKTKPDQLKWLFENGKRVIQNNAYPNDSIITVSTTTKKTILGEETYKEFNFPFINKNDPDSTMYFKIAILEGEIYKLMLSTGMKFL